MLPPSRTGGASLLDSDVSSTRGEDFVDGMRTPSTVADTELAWEAGFKAGQEAALLVNEDQWSEVLAKRVSELAQTASEYMLGDESTDKLHPWHSDVSPPASLPAPGIAGGGGGHLHHHHHRSTSSPPPIGGGRLSPSAVGGGGACAQLGVESSMDPSIDPEFQSMFESKYERVIEVREKSSAPVNCGGGGGGGGAINTTTTTNTTTATHNKAGGGVDTVSGSTLSATAAAAADTSKLISSTSQQQQHQQQHSSTSTSNGMLLRVPSSEPGGGVDAAGIAAAIDAARKQTNRPLSSASPPPPPPQQHHGSTSPNPNNDQISSSASSLNGLFMMLSPGTRLPTHISIFGDDLGSADTLAAMQKFGPPPAQAANLPSHISVFGGGSDAEADAEAGAEAEALAVAYAALPDDDVILGGGGGTITTGGGPPPALPPDAALLPTHFDLADAAAAAASQRQRNNNNNNMLPNGGGNGGVGEGALPAAPPPSTLHHRPPSSILSTVPQLDSSQLTVIAKIGEGSFGEVSLCQCPSYGRFAVKWIKSSRVERWTSFWREAELMSRLNHPNVLRFFGLVTQGEFVVGIMTEFAASGSLASFLRRGQNQGGGGGEEPPSGGGSGFLSLKQRAHLAVHAANGMAYLHSQKIVHFDVKPDNLLVDGDWSTPDGPVLKVADFGLSVVKANTFCSDVHDLRGTLPYMAPEMVTDHKHVTEAADVWSLGVVFWELLTQQQPYADIAPAQLLGALGSGTARLPIPDWCEPEWRALMEGCWVADPSLRPTCRQLAVQLQRIKDGGIC